MLDLDFMPPKKEKKAPQIDNLDSFGHRPAKGGDDDIKNLFRIPIHQKCSTLPVGIKINKEMLEAYDKEERKRAEEKKHFLLRYARNFSDLDL